MKRNGILRKEMSRRAFLRYAGVTGAGLVLSGKAGRLSAQPKEVLIGQVVTLTGAGATWGQKQHAGLKFFVEEINAAGGIKSLGGAKLKLVALDNETKVDVNKIQMERMCSMDPVAIFGNISSPATMVGTLVSEKYKIPQLVINSTKEEITERGLKYVFRYTSKAFWGAQRICEFIDWIWKETGIGPKKVAIMVVEGWERVAKTFEDWAKAKNIHYDTFMYPWTQDDFTVRLSRYKAAGVDLLLKVAYPRDSVKIVQNLKTLDYNLLAAIDNPGGVTAPEFVEMLGKDAEHWIASDFYAHDYNNTPFVKPINERFKKHSGYDLEHSSGQVICGASALVDALERAGTTDREKIREALSKTNLKYGQYYIAIPEGVRFNEHGDNMEQMISITQWRGGFRHIIHPPKHATMKPIWPMPKWSERG